jgi:hypothetical protein
MLQSGSRLGTPPLGFHPWGASLPALLVDAAPPLRYFDNAPLAQRLSLHLPRQFLIFHPLDFSRKEVRPGIAR